MKFSIGDPYCNTLKNCTLVHTRQFLLPIKVG